MGPNQSIEIICANFLVLGGMATAARQLTLIRRRSFELQQFG
jgi:hypothetical protein